MSGEVTTIGGAAVIIGILYGGYHYVRNILQIRRGGKADKKEKRDVSSKHDNR